MRSGAAAGDSRFAFGSGESGRPSTDSRVITAAAVAAPAAKAQSSASSTGKAPSVSATPSAAATAGGPLRGGRRRGIRSNAASVPHVRPLGDCEPAAGQARTASAAGSRRGGHTTALLREALPAAQRAPNARRAADSAAHCGGSPRCGCRQTLCRDAAAIVAGGMRRDARRTGRLCLWSLIHRYK